MSSIDSISKQQELEKFLSPNWIESPGCLSYSKRFIVVHLHRLRYFFKDLFIRHQFKYRNDHWVSHKIIKNPISNKYTDALTQKLLRRKIIVLTEEVLLKKIRAFSETNTLYEKAKQIVKAIANKDLKVQFVSQFPFRAECDYFEGIIQIRANLGKEEALCCLVFELLNAARAQEFFAIHQQALVGEIDAKEYAKRNEKIEFENTQTWKQIIGLAIKENGWHPSIIQHGKVCETFESYLIFARKRGHFQYYLRQFDNIKQEAKSL